MDFSLTNDQSVIKSMVQSFAKEKMEPFANKWDQEKIYQTFLKRLV